MIGNALIRWLHPVLEPSGLREADEAMQRAAEMEQEARSKLQQVRRAMDPRYATPRSGEVARLKSQLGDADAAMREALGDDD